MNNKFRTVRGYELIRNNEEKLTPALEDYLEMIYRNSFQEPYIRVNVLAQLLNVRDSSVTKMIQKLGELGLVNYEKYGIVTLTEEGKDTGEFLLSRHDIIENFLSLIGCKEDRLIQTELIEHSITPDTVEKIECMYNFFNENAEIMEKYKEYTKSYFSNKA